jgi:NADPH-dependent curcumin reductase CurA
MEQNMSETAVRQIVLASRPKGPPAAENFRLEEVPMPPLPPGGLLLRVLYLSLDPTCAAAWMIGNPMPSRSASAR